MKYDVAFLKKNPVFWSRMGMHYDPTLIKKNGEIYLFAEDHRRYANYHDAFAEAGVKVHTCVIHSGWIGVDAYDYSLTDRVLAEFFKNNPEGLFIPRVKLNVPVDWCRAYPEELFVYDNGADDRERVAELVATPKQEYLGYTAASEAEGEDYYKYYALHDKDCRISLQSFSSEQWLTDAGIALERLMAHIEAMYGDRIIGYHVAYGHYGESMPWGREFQHYGDYSRKNLRAFYEWAVKKHGSHEAVERAWGISPLCPNEVFLPSGYDRYHKISDLRTLFREDCPIAVEYDEFTADMNTRAMIYFCRLVKEKTGKLAGGFYGYSNFMENANYAGHLGFQRLLEAPEVDFFAAPKSYHRCSIGEPGGYMCPVDSINRHKLWLDELDNRTYLCNDAYAQSVAAGEAETVNILFRELCKNLSHDAGFWWMDLGGGWYDDPRLMEVVKRMVAIKEQVERMPHHSIADVLVLTDEACMARMRCNSRFLSAYNRDLTCELALSGVLFDSYRLADLDKIDTAQYKLIIFAYCFEANEKLCQRVKALEAEGKTVMFNHAAGIWYEGRYDIQNVERFTGFSVVEGPMNDGYPGVSVLVDGERRPLAQVGRRILNTVPPLARGELRRIAEGAGCRLWAEAGCICYGDDRFLGVFSGTGEITVRFSERGTYRDLVSGQRFVNVDRVSYTADKTTARIFIAER